MYKSDKLYALYLYDKLARLSWSQIQLPDRMSSLKLTLGTFSHLVSGVTFRTDFWLSVHRWTGHSLHFLATESIILLSYSFTAENYGLQKLKIADLTGNIEWDASNEIITNNNYA